jgi:hypothetical protein
MENAHAQGLLQDAKIGALATANEFENLAAALGLLCGRPTDATTAFLRLRKVSRARSPGEYERCPQSFAGLK